MLVAQCSIFDGERDKCSATGGTRNRVQLSLHPLLGLHLLSSMSDKLSSDFKVLCPRLLAHEGSQYKDRNVLLGKFNGVFFAPGSKIKITKKKKNRNSKNQIFHWMPVSSQYKT